MALFDLLDPNKDQTEFFAFLENASRDRIAQSDRAELGDLKTTVTPDLIDKMMTANKVHDKDFALFGSLKGQSGLILDVGCDYGYSVSSMRAAGYDGAIFSVEALDIFRSAFERIAQVDRFEYHFELTPAHDSVAEIRLLTLVVNGYPLGGLSSVDPWRMRHAIWRNLRNHFPNLRAAELQWFITRKTARPLDLIVAERFADRPITAMKIDVEGHELSVLAGASGIIARYRPMCLIEGGAQTEPVHKFMLQRGYTLMDPLNPTKPMERSNAGVNSLFVSNVSV